MENKIKIGVCGFGKMGKRHYETYKKFDNVEIKNIFDPCIPGKDDFNEFLEHVERLDGVSICSPSSFHLENMKSILSANSNIKILVEKPISDELFDIKDLEPYAANILVGHIERFNPVINRLKSLISSRNEKIINIKTKRLGFYIPHDDGNIAQDLLVHDIDIICYLLGQKISDSYLFSFPSKYAFLISKFKNIITESEVSWVQPNKERTIEITIKGGLYKADYITQKLFFYDASGFEYDLTLSDNLVFPLDLQLKHFLDIVDGKSTPSCDIFDGFRAIKTILNPTKYVELR